MGAPLRGPTPAETEIAPREGRESGSVPAASQSQICVSNRTSRASDVLGISRPFEIVYGADNVAANFDCARHIAEQIDRLVVDRDQLRDRLSALGYDERRALLRHLIHQSQAPGL